jgi:hypothetical protein
MESITYLHHLASCPQNAHLYHPNLSTSLTSLSCLLLTNFSMTVLYNKNNPAVITEHTAVTTTVTLAVTEY